MEALFAKRVSKRAKDAGATLYSEWLAGDRGNWNYEARVDVNARGYVGVTQRLENGTSERVLLSADQFKAIADFVRRADFTEW